MALAPRAPARPTWAGIVGSLFGGSLAWGLAESEHYLIWSLASAFLLFALSAWFVPARGDLQRSRKLPLDTLLGGAAGLLLTLAWARGPSLLALLTAFWAFRLFAEFGPTWPLVLIGPGGGIPARMTDLPSALWAFLAVMLPLRLWVDAPW